MQAQQGIRGGHNDHGPLHYAHASAAGSGITLTEILIAILILGVGLVSLATLFPIGLLRLRDAARYTRSTYLTESARRRPVGAALVEPPARSASPISINYQLLQLRILVHTRSARPLAPANRTHPLTQDTPAYGAGSTATRPRPPAANDPGRRLPHLGGYGLPFAYDPLWRSSNRRTRNRPAHSGYYLERHTFEARFASGIGFIRNDPSDRRHVPSAHGLQRITNFNRPRSSLGAVIRHSQHLRFARGRGLARGDQPDVLQSAKNSVVTTAKDDPVAASSPSPVIPDLSLSTDANGNPIHDQRLALFLDVHRPPGQSVQPGASRSTATS